MIPGETSENHAAAAWIAGTLNAAQRQEFEAHLATCPQCQEQCGAMITRTMRQLQEPPPAAAAAQPEVAPDKSSSAVGRNVLIALCAALVLIAGFALGWWAWQIAHR